jgi:protein-tyrosine phosphatase
VTAPRSPCDVTAGDLAGADLIVAVKELEHRPVLVRRFPAFTERVRYWNVDDIPQVPAAHALARLEELVRALVVELRDASAPRP